jgi:hypothetical protein
MVQRSRHDSQSSKERELLKVVLVHFSLPWIASWAFYYWTGRVSAGVCLGALVVLVNYWASRIVAALDRATTHGD